ncbi:MAG: hypothetical protein LQ351_007627 [Letrouitia transgressa]|nr:MAG: hypothetical protein LQ351_007627 [Letrouitia transgressa]
MAEEKVPRQHKAVVYDEPGKLSTKIVMVDTPAPGAGEVLDQIGGHEGVGVIVRMGPETATATVSVGQRVGIKWVAGICGSCLACLEGAEPLCRSCRISGYYSPGTFQQYVVSPANYVTPIPDALESADAAVMNPLPPSLARRMKKDGTADHIQPLLCAGITTYAALRRSQAKSGQWVVISGAGGGLGE